jgi:hypothetical protein
VMSNVQKIVISIRAKSLQHKLFKRLLDETVWHYGDLMSHVEICWLSEGNILFTFQEFLLVSGEFFLGKNWFTSAFKRFPVVARAEFPHASCRWTK